MGTHRVGEGQVEDCRVVVGGEGEPSVDPWSVEERN